MTRTILLFVSTLAGLVPVGLALSAQERPAPRTTGRVLLLRNHRALEGDIERVGGVYLIRRAAAEVTVQGDEALWLCADWDEAYGLMCRQANLRDPDERVRLARWCDSNGLYARALAEVEAALRLRADHPTARRLLPQLQRTANARSAPSPAGPTHDAEVGTAPAVDLSAETLSLFTAKVQPVLMNTCASCHATGRGGEFKLARCYDPTVNRRALHHNLSAVLAYVDLEQPSASPLLYKSVSAHGGAAHAPLPGRQSLPFRHLQEWVESVVANNPHLRKVLARQTAASTPAQKPPATAASEAAPVIVSREKPQNDESPAPSPSPTQPEPTAQAAPTAPRQTDPSDEFDALIFNRQAHPQR
ncbi:MAG: hypothetical protein L0Z62_49210 [Gemmataceae bacterium]|nr:hypothetical protein [Gemmataceae bacterium]